MAIGLDAFNDIILSIEKMMINGLSELRNHFWDVP